MPFRHVAMYRWSAAVGPEHVDRVRAAFDELASLVTGLQHHAHGTDVGVSEGTYDYIVVADFDSVTDWRTYRDHPAHVLLLAELIDGHAVDRAGGQFQVPDTGGPAMDAGVEQPLTDHDPPDVPEESDAELLARARRAAMAEMEAWLAEPDDPA